MRRRRTTLAIILSTALLAPILLRGGGPILFKTDGTAFAWSTSSSVELNPDLGALGAIVDPSTILTHAQGQWNGVSTSALTLSIGTSLAADVDGLSEAEFNTLITNNDGTNPIIYDDDGAIFSAIFGSGSNVLGIAGPSLVITGQGRIVKGYAMFNGANIDAGDSEMLKAVFTHELGHFLNLDHTQINGNRLGESLTGFGATPALVNVATMFPILLSQSTSPHPMATLHTDDKASFSALYPDTSFASSTGTISGTVFDIDGTTHLQGVNVVARNVADPLNDAVTYVSGTSATETNGFEPAGQRGVYTLRGLTPGASYRVGIEEVGASFVAGSSVGPLDPPADLDASDANAFLEFWNDASEAANNPPDDPSDATDITVTAGATESNIDIIFNGTAPRPSGIAPSSGVFSSTHAVTITGTNLGTVTSAQLIGPSSVALTGVIAVDATTLTGTVPADVVPGSYVVRATNPAGTGDSGAALYSSTEPAPTVASVNPTAIDNTQAEALTITGENFLGARNLQLVANGQPVVQIDSLTITSTATAPDLKGAALGTFTIVAILPAGTIPGNHEVFVENTAGLSAPTALRIDISELAATLDGTVTPDTFQNSSDTLVTISGTNLAGTQTVTITGEDGTFSLAIQSTSLTQVVATVTTSVTAGTYTVQLTNTVGAASGSATITVQAGGGGGGGGGCGAGLPIGGRPPGYELPTILAAALVLQLIRRLGRARVAGQLS